jgi:HlyD family secretion protein
MKKNITYILIIGCLVVTSILVFMYYLNHKTSTEMQIKTEICHKGKIVNSITATGTVKPILQVEVGTQVSGTIKKIYVDFNSQVKKGQLLAEIDRTVLESTFLSAKTDLASNKANLDYQEKIYNRVKSLYGKKAVSESDYESAEYNYKKTKCDYEKSESQVTTAQTNLDYSRIYSPINGVILSRAVDEGQTVAASFSTPTLFTIANDLTKMKVIANVDEADIGQVKKEQKVLFTVDAFPNDTFKGTVTQLRLEPTTISNVVTYSVVIDAPNPDLKLMPGLTANITVYTLEKENVLLISAQAIHFSPDKLMLSMLLKSSQNSIEKEKLKSNEKRIWIKEGNNILPKIIEIGETDGINYEVKKGLKETDEVVLSIAQTSKQTITKTKDNENTTTSPFMPSHPKTKNNGDHPPF